MKQQEAQQTQRTDGTHALHLGMLRDINLGNYPATRTHYLAYALQFGLKPPSVSTMDRCERRNQVKAGLGKAAEVSGSSSVGFVKKKKKVFVLPKRYDPSMFNERRNRRNMRLSNNARRKVKKGKVKPAYIPGKVFPPRNPIEIPEEIEPKQKTKTAPKQREKVFVVHQPEWIQLKAERTKFREEIEEYRKNYMKPESKPLPEYFRKRRDNQKRRRKQKQDLITSNKQTLEQIFGKNIYQKGWPVSRRDIKLALGVDPDNDEEDKNVEAYAEFMDMVEEDGKVSGSKRKRKGRSREMSNDEGRNVRQRPKSGSKKVHNVPKSRPTKKYHRDYSYPRPNSRKK